MTDTIVAATKFEALKSAALDINNYKIAAGTRAHNAQIIQVLERAARKHKLKCLEQGATPQNSGVPIDEDAIQIDALDLVNALHSKGDLSRNSLVTYRAALQRYLVWHRTDPKCQRALQVLLAACPAKTRKRRKNRTFPSTDFSDLRNALFDTQVVQKSFWAGRAVAWLDVGIVTGLRPIEWSTVVWADAEMTTLRVTNAKVKVDVPGFLRKGKSNRTADAKLSNSAPTTRDIPVLAPNRQLVIRHLAMIAQAKEDGIAFATYHKQVSQAIRRACKLVWEGKKKYTLYSLRKQFAANAADAFGVEVSSKMMGHSNPQNPAASAYGLACQAYARVGKGAQKMQSQAEDQHSAEGQAPQRSAAPCRFLTYQAAKMELKHAADRCRC